MGDTARDDIAGYVQCSKCGTKHAVRKDSKASGPWCCYHRLAPYRYCRTMNHDDFQKIIRAGGR